MKFKLKKIALDCRNIQLCIAKFRCLLLQSKSPFSVQFHAKEKSIFPLKNHIKKYEIERNASIGDIHHDLDKR